MLRMCHISYLKEVPILPRLSQYKSILASVTCAQVVANTEYSGRVFNLTAILLLCISYMYLPGILLWRSFSRLGDFCVCNGRISYYAIVKILKS